MSPWPRTNNFSPTNVAEPAPVSKSQVRVHQDPYAGMVTVKPVAEAAARQNAFWPMHELFLERQDAPSMHDLKRYAAELGLDTERVRSL